MTAPTGGRLLKSKRSPQKTLSVFSLQDVRAYRQSSRQSSQKYLQENQPTAVRGRSRGGADVAVQSGVTVPLLGGQIFGLHHPQREDVLQPPTVVPVGVDGSPQVLHPLVPLGCRAAGEALGARGRGHLGDT